MLLVRLTRNTKWTCTKRTLKEMQCNYFVMIKWLVVAEFWSTPDFRNFVSQHCTIFPTFYCPFSSCHFDFLGCLFVLRCLIDHTKILMLRSSCGTWFSKTAIMQSFRSQFIIFFCVEPVSVPVYCYIMYTTPVGYKNTTSLWPFNQLNLE